MKVEYQSCKNEKTAISGGFVRNFGLLICSRAYRSSTAKGLE
ncbi:MAG TPA: hypothetical protein VM406_12375 [Noviherbaspirillum sp.]|nr:hypothetical protein [Noviherbaspirillum sp.]